MTHFYLVLPSNSSHSYYPNNTLTDYTTKLASTIELTNDWEVGLAEIMFPRNWFTIPKEGVYFEVDIILDKAKPFDFSDGDSEEFAERLSVPTVKVYLNGGFFHSMEEFVMELNHAGQRAFVKYPDLTFGPPLFYYKAISRRIYVDLFAGMSVTFQPILECILGLGPDQNPLKNLSLQNVNKRCELSSDLQAGIHALYVYCDLLQHTYVGDIKAPLLRVVNSGVEAGDVITRYYERPRYVPLQKKSFDSIQIIIRDDLGEKIQFENGKVLLTLHFRRAFNRYLL